MRWTLMSACSASRGVSMGTSLCKQRGSRSKNRPRQRVRQCVCVTLTPAPDFIMVIVMPLDGFTPLIVKTHVTVTVETVRRAYAQRLGVKPESFW